MLTRRHVGKLLIAILVDVERILHVGYAILHAGDQLVAWLGLEH